MTEITQLTRERKFEIDSRLFDIREILTGPNVTGAQRNELETELKELSLERYASNNPDPVVDGREGAVTLAESYEKRAEDETLSEGERQRHKQTAAAIRQGIITSDVKSADAEELHTKLSDDGKKLRIKQDAEHQTYVEQNQKELDDARQAEMNKQL